MSAYAFLSASLVASCKSAAAQIVYHDVEPDDTLTIVGLDGEWYSLDMNNDGITDYSLAAELIYFENAAMIGNNVESNSNSIVGTYYNLFA